MASSSRFSSLSLGYNAESAFAKRRKSGPRSCSALTNLPQSRCKLYGKQTPHSVDTFPHGRYFFPRIKGVSNFPSSVNINEFGTWRIEHDAD